MKNIGGMSLASAIVVILLVFGGLVGGYILGKNDLIRIGDRVAQPETFGSILTPGDIAEVINPSATPEPLSLGKLIQPDVPEPKGCPVVVEPAANSSVQFPLSISGYFSAGCKWTVFEGQIGVVYVLDTASGQRLSDEIPLTIVSNDSLPVYPIYFTATIPILTALPAGDSAQIKIVEDDPSGEKVPQTFMVPVTL